MLFKNIQIHFPLMFPFKPNSTTDLTFTWKERDEK